MTPAGLKNNLVVLFGPDTPAPTPRSLNERPLKERNISPIISVARANRRLAATLRQGMPVTRVFGSGEGSGAILIACGFPSDGCRPDLLSEFASPTVGIAGREGILVITRFVGIRAKMCTIDEPYAGFLELTVEVEPALINTLNLNEGDGHALSAIQFVSVNTGNDMVALVNTGYDDRLRLRR